MSFWNLMFGEPERWAHVHVHKYAITRSKSEEKGHLYVHFYESSEGNRKVKYETSFNDDNGEITVDKVQHLDYYQETVIRWLDGRFDPEIPRYQDIGEEETADALRGKRS